MEPDDAVTGRLIAAVGAVETVRLAAGADAFPKKFDVVEAELWRKKVAPRLDARTLAALSGATVVVGVGYRSGSLNVAARATQLGRPVGAVPGPVTSAASAGAHRLLREGVAPLVADTADVRVLLDPPATSGERTFERESGIARSSPRQTRAL